MKLCLLCSAKYENDVKVCAKDGSRLVLAGDDSLVNTDVGGKYHVDEMIGKGSLGRVYRAHRLSDGMQVALKVLRENLSTDDEALARFRREAQMLSIIEHPNIVTLYDFGQTNIGEPYYAAEFLDGRTLATVISESRCLTISEAEPIFEQVCAGLSEAHSHGFIHRDIKPSNIMLLARDEGHVAKILDFSLAKLPPLAVEAKVTKDGMLRGTPAYMSPEQCQSMEVDPRSDIYSLGVVVFETLTGLRPFASKNSVVTMHQQMNDAPPLMMAVRNDLYFCQELESLVQKCLAKKPEARPQSVEEFLQEFRDACLAQRNVAKSDTPPVYYQDKVESINKLSPLEKFIEADNRRIAREKILSTGEEVPNSKASAKELAELDGHDEAIETIRLTTDELKTQQPPQNTEPAVPAVPGTDAVRKVGATDGSELPAASPIPPPNPYALNLATWLSSPRGRKIILGILLIVLVIIGLGILLTVQIPNPEAQ